jgi:CBS domain containing-hemolysin-like protein
VSTLLTGILIVVLVLLAAFASLAETAIGRMSRMTAHHLDHVRKGGAKRLIAIVEDPAQAMAAVLLVKLTAQIVATVLATYLVLREWELDGWAVVGAAVAITFVIFTFCELVPRTFTVQRTEQTALAVSRPIFFIARLLKPISKILILLANATMVLLPGKGLPKGPFVTEDEIKRMVDVAVEDDEGEIEEEERELIHSVFEFGDTVVREVMVPRPDMVAIRSDATWNEALTLITEAGYSRIPIYEGDTDNIIGMLYAKDLLRRMHEAKRETVVSALGRAPLFVPEQKKVSELLREMQNQHVHMAIVVDEYGGTAGLVTIEDLIEEIVGEIVDEYDREEPLVEPVDDSTIRVDAKMPIDEVNELLNVELPHEEWDTVGGLVFGLTGRVPHPGEVVDYDSLSFRTERVSGRRIQKVVITKNPEPAEDEEA